MEKTGRNAPCLCGSGKKYKKCCLPKEEEHPGHNKLLARVRESSFVEDGIVVDSPANEKMSQIILDFAEPLIKQSQNGWSIESAIGMAILVWNASLVPEGGMREKLVDEICKCFPPGQGVDPMEFKILTKKVVDLLWERKKKKFAVHKRFIVDYQFEPKGDGFNLNVCSVMENSGEAYERSQR